MRHNDSSCIITGRAQELFTRRKEKHKEDCGELGGTD